VQKVPARLLHTPATKKTVTGVRQVTVFRLKPARASGYPLKHHQERGIAARSGRRPVEPHAHRSVTRLLSCPGTANLASIQTMRPLRDYKVIRSQTGI
jgi:hypothetical protein